MGHTFARALHSGLALAPACRTDIPMGLVELQSVHHAQHLVDIPSEGQVVDHLVSDHAGTVDEERATQRNIPRRRFHPVRLADAVRQIGHQRIANRTDAAVIDTRVAPGVVCVMGVHRNADDLDLPGLKVVQPVIEGNQLGRANEGEIQRIEEQHSVPALGGTREVEVVDEDTVPENGSGR